MPLASLTNLAVSHYFALSRELLSLSPKESNQRKGARHVVDSREAKARVDALRFSRSPGYRADGPSMARHRSAGIHARCPLRSLRCSAPCNGGERKKHSPSKGHGNVQVTSHDHSETAAHSPVIPAKAGIQCSVARGARTSKLDPRMRGDDEES